jgi:cell division protease FtsH
VRDLFKRARASAPAIVFIDEIDTIGRARTGSGAPDAKEREQGLLQLLVEMDGFDTKKSGVLLIGATNRKEVLDAALLRSGRFDRVLRMGLPTLAERYDVLGVHAVGKIVPRHGDSVSDEFPDGDALLHTAAMLTEGYSGADLANLLNEAAILAVRRNKPFVDLAEVETAMEKLKVGLPRAPLGDSVFKRQLAWVYAGRAVLQTAAAALQPDVLQVSISPRGSTVARLDSMPAKRSWGRPGSEAALHPSRSSSHADDLQQIARGRQRSASTRAPLTRAR